MPLRWIPWIVVLTFVVSGSLDAVFWTPEDPLGPTYIPHAIVVGALCFFWCKTHAREAGTELPSGSALLSGLLPPIGVPLYLLRSQGWKRGWLRATKALLVGALALILYEASFRMTTWIVH